MSRIAIGAVLVVLVAVAFADKASVRKEAEAHQKQYEAKNDGVCGCPGPTYKIDWASFSGKDFDALGGNGEVAMGRAGNMPECFYGENLGRFCSKEHKATFCKKVKGVVITTHFKSHGGDSVAAKSGKGWDAYVSDETNVDCRTIGAAFEAY